MPSTICSTITTRKYIPPPPRRSSDRVTTEAITRAKNITKAFITPCSQRHRHHVAVGDVRHFMGEHALDFLGPHRSQQSG
jgi:hypothetical protein